MANRWFGLSLAAACAVLGARPAFATTVGPLDPPSIDINGSALGCASRDGLFTCGGSNLAGGGFALDSWSFVLNPDPSITGNFTLTNLSTMTQDFVLTITLPVAPLGPSLSITGSIGAGTLTDLNANGATLSDDGHPIYAARLDGSAVRTLLDPSQSFSAAADPFGAPSTATIPLASFGPEPLAQSVNSTISLQVRFMLTPSDQVSLPVQFAVTAVPEPGTLLLLGCAGAALVASRRRLSA